MDGAGGGESRAVQYEIWCLVVRNSARRTCHLRTDSVPAYVHFTFAPFAVWWLIVCQASVFWGRIRKQNVVLTVRQIRTQSVCLCQQVGTKIRPGFVRRHDVMTRLFLCKKQTKVARSICVFNMLKIQCYFVDWAIQNLCHNSSIFHIKIGSINWDYPRWYIEDYCSDMIEVFKILSGVYDNNTVPEKVI